MIKNKEEQDGRFENNKEGNTMSVIADPEKTIPKYSNLITYAFNEDTRKVIISFLFKEKDQNPILIERVILEEGHIDQMIGVLKKIRE